MITGRSAGEAVMKKEKFLKDIGSRYDTRPFKSSNGPIEMPIRYWENNAVFMLFHADYDRVNDLVAPSGLTLCQYMNGKAVVSVNFFEYLNSSIGSYNEVGVAPFVTYPPYRTTRFPSLDLYRRGENWNIGAYILDLPVSTDIAVAGGREIWGLPKFKTDMPFSLTGTRFDGTIEDPAGGEPIAVVGGRIFPSVPWFPPDIVLFNNHKGSIVRTVIKSSGTGRAVLPGHTVRMAVGSGNHRMAENLRHMGLHDAKPFIVMVATSLHAILPYGTEVGKV
jgi:hypothetical protein